MNNKEDKIFHILAGMQCLRDLTNWLVYEDNDNVVINATTEFGRNGHGKQSDYLYTIAKTVERIESIDCGVKIIKYVFDALDDVGHVDWKIFFNTLKS